MAGAAGLTLVARRDDGAYLVTVADSPCALLISVDDDGAVGIWASPLDVFTGRGEWARASGALPDDVAKTVKDFVSKDGWCDDE